MKLTAHQNLKAAPSIRPSTHTTGTTNGAAVDAQGYDEALVVLDIGTVATGGTLAVTIEDSTASGSGFAAVSGAALPATGTYSAGSAIYVARLDIRKRNRYLRAVGVVGVANVDYSVHFILGTPKVPPVTQVNTTVFDV